jgi:hypothetical protein
VINNNNNNVTINNDPDSVSEKHDTSVEDVFVDVSE